MNVSGNTIAQARSFVAAGVAWRRGVNSAWLVATSALAFGLLVPLLAILGYLLVKGLSSLDWNFFTQIPKPVGETGGGVANAILGSLIVIGVAAVGAIPIGILAATYLYELARGSKLSTAVRFACDMLNATPSIILGIFAYSVLVLTMGRFSAVAGSFALFIMMTPVVVRATEEILRTVPDSIREASLALGAAKWQTIWHVVLPAARKGITTGVFLALARISGETAPLLFTALGNDYWSVRLDQPINTLPVQIFKFATSPYADWHRQAWAAALLLVLLISLANAVARLTTRQR